VFSAEYHPTYEWNTGRKIWHCGGSLLMITIFYLGYNLPEMIWPKISGLMFLMIFAWTETLMTMIIDIIRFYYPEQNQAIKRWFLWGSWMSRHEHTKFNSATYYLLAAAILITGYYLGWFSELVLVMAIAVVGFADPISALVRYQRQQKGLGREKLWGLIAYFITSVLVMIAVKWLLQGQLSLNCILCLGAIAAVVESYTMEGVVMVRPLTIRFQNAVRHWIIEWLFRFFPDDNFAVPIAIAFSAIVLGPVI